MLDGDIKDSAYRHGIDTDDIEHAYRWWVASRSVWDASGRHITILIGPAWSGALIEIGMNDFGDIIHAMKARKRFLQPAKRR